jgi:uncharacterized protein YqgC (DUF456 family)
VGTFLVGMVMVVGLVGVVVPILPGTFLILGAGVAWAALVADPGTGRWVVVAVMTALFTLGIIAKYALPGHHLGTLPRSTLLAAVVGAGVGMVVLPPFGLLLGGLVGCYLAEARRLGPGAGARRSTVRAVRAVGLGILAELAAAVLMVGTWLVGLVVT